MAFVASNSTIRQRGQNNDQQDSSQEHRLRNSPVVMTIRSVDLSGQGSMQVEVTRDDNPDADHLEPGIYTVSMDTNVINHQERATRAAKATGPFYGGMINEKTKKREGKKIMAEGVVMTGPGEMAIRWMNTAGKANENRAGIVHTRKTKIDGFDAVVATGTTLLDTNALPVYDEEGNFHPEFQKTLKTAQTNFENKTVANNAVNSNGDEINWSSLPSTSVMLAARDKATGMVIETTELMNKITTPAPEDYPDWLPAEDRAWVDGRGRANARPIPYSAQKLATEASNFTDYLKGQHPDKDIEVIAVRGTRLESTKVLSFANFHMVGKLGANRPVSQCHEGNKMRFRLDPNDDQVTMDDMCFVPSISVHFMRNTTEKFHKYTAHQHGYPTEGVHFLTKMRYNNTPIQLHPKLATPVNAPTSPAQQNEQQMQGQNQAPQTQQQAPAQSQPQHGQANASVPNQNEAPAHTNSPSQQASGQQAAVQSNNVNQASPEPQQAALPDGEPKTSGPSQEHYLSLIHISEPTRPY